MQQKHGWKVTMCGGCLQSRDTAPSGKPQLYIKMASRFLCFGDSLTEVYSSIGCKFVGSSSAVSVHVVLLVVMAQVILSRPVFCCASDTRN